MAAEFDANAALVSGLDLADVDYQLEELLRIGRLDGSLIKAKLRAFYEEILIPRMAKMLANPDAPASVVMDVAKHVVQVADLLPRQAQITAGANVGLSINISMPEGFQKPGRPDGTSMTIDVTPTVIEPDPLLIPEEEPVPEVQPFKVPDFQGMKPKPEPERL